MKNKSLRRLPYELYRLSNQGVQNTGKSSGSRTPEKSNFRQLLRQQEDFRKVRDRARGEMSRNQVRTARRPKGLTHAHVATVEPSSALNEDCLDAVAQKNPDTPQATPRHTRRTRKGLLPPLLPLPPPWRGAEQREAFGTVFAPEPGQNLLLLFLLLLLLLSFDLSAWAVRKESAEDSTISQDRHGQGRPTVDRAASHSRSLRRGNLRKRRRPRPRWRSLLALASYVTWSAPLPPSALPPQPRGAVRCGGEPLPQRQRRSAARVATTSAGITPDDGGHWLYRRQLRVQPSQ